MSLPNKNDHDLGILPNTAGGFAKKIERYAKIAEGLRIDPKKWEDAQAQITDPKLRQSKPPAVTLTTVHSVKGLEWPHCTVLMPKGLFPIELSVKPGEEPPTDQEMFEHDVSERNLAYVAFTRAAKTLTVMAIPQMNKLSPYIRDAGLKPGENVPKPGAEVSPDPDPDIKTASTEDLTEGVWHYEQWPRLGASVTYDRRMP
jgi:superfamily I DNA/RNA helicase